MPKVLIKTFSQRIPPIINPGSGGKKKRLAPKLVALLTKRLLNFHHSPLLILGPAEEKKYINDLSSAFINIKYKSLINPSIINLAKILLRSPAYIGADSGVTHLAAALGVPTLAIFQTSDPNIWTPNGAMVLTCSADEATELTSWPLPYKII